MKCNLLHAFAGTVLMLTVVPAGSEKVGCNEEAAQEFEVATNSLQDFIRPPH
jgi:hypothetical protein